MEGDLVSHTAAAWGHYQRLFVSLPPCEASSGGAVDPLTLSQYIHQPPPDGPGPLTSGSGSFFDFPISLAYYLLAVLKYPG